MNVSDVSKHSNLRVWPKPFQTFQVAVVISRPWFHQPSPNESVMWRVHVLPAVTETGAGDSPSGGYGAPVPLNVVALSSLQVRVQPMSALRATAPSYEYRYEPYGPCWRPTSSVTWMDWFVACSLGTTNVRSAEEQFIVSSRLNAFQ